MAQAEFHRHGGTAKILPNIDAALAGRANCTG